MNKYEQFYLFSSGCRCYSIDFAFYKAMTINKSEAGNDRMKEIASAIAEGARAFLFAEYKVLVIFVAVLFVVLGFGISWLTAVCFLVGALFSTLAGYFGMTVATKANVRTANAAKESGMNKALSIRFFRRCCLWVLALQVLVLLE